MVSQVSDVVIGPLILFLCDLNTKQDKYGIAFFILHVEPSVESKFIFIFHKGSVLPASPKAKAGLGVQSLRPSVRPSVPKSCHRNSSEITDPIIMKLGM